MKRKRYKHRVLLACSALAAWGSVYGVDAQNPSASKRTVEANVLDYVSFKYESESTLEAIALDTLRRDIEYKRAQLRKKSKRKKKNSILEEELKCLEALRDRIIAQIFGIANQPPNTKWTIGEKTSLDTNSTPVTTWVEQVEAWHFLRAIRENDAAGLRRLIRTGSEGEAQGIWFLKKAVAEGKVEQLDLLINAGVDIHQSIDGQLTLADLALQKQQWQVVSRLLEHGVEPPLFASEHIQKLWVISAEIGGLALMKHLVEHENADIHRQDRYGRTALHWACQQGHSDVVEYLIAKGVAVDEQDTMGKRPIDYARSPSIMRVLTHAERIPLPATKAIKNQIMANHI